MCWVPTGRRGHAASTRLGQRGRQTDLETWTGGDLIHRQGRRQLPNESCDMTFRCYLKDIPTSAQKKKEEVFLNMTDGVCPGMSQLVVTSQMTRPVMVLVSICRSDEFDRNEV